jgi:hypothetical protein
LESFIIWRFYRKTMKNKKNSNKGFVVGIVICVVLVGAVLLAVYLNENKKIEKLDTSEMILKIHKDFGIEIPNNWNEYVPKIDATKGAMYVYVPSNQNVTYVASEKVIITIAYFPEGNSPNLNDMLNQGLNVTKKAIPDLEMTEGPTDFTMGGMSGIKMKFTGTSNKEKLEFTQISVKNPKNVYTISYHCPFEECNYYDVFDNIVETFALKNSQ